MAPIADHPPCCGSRRRWSGGSAARRELALRREHHCVGFDDGHREGTDPRREAEAPGIELSGVQRHIETQLDQLSRGTAALCQRGATPMTRKPPLVSRRLQLQRRAGGQLDDAMAKSSPACTLIVYAPVAVVVDEGAAESVVVGLRPTRTSAPAIGRAQRICYGAAQVGALCGGRVGVALPAPHATNSTALTVAAAVSRGCVAIPQDNVPRDARTPAAASPRPARLGDRLARSASPAPGVSSSTCRRDSKVTARMLPSASTANPAPRAERRTAHPRPAADAGTAGPRRVDTAPRPGGSPARRLRRRADLRA